MGPYCKFCNQRCFVPFPQDTPQEIITVYGTSTIIATCAVGQDFERRKVGYCYDMIKEAIDGKQVERVQTVSLKALGEEGEWYLIDTDVGFTKEELQPLADKMKQANVAILGTGERVKISPKRYTVGFVLDALSKVDVT